MATRKAAPKKKTAAAAKKKKAAAVKSSSKKSSTSKAKKTKASPKRKAGPKAKASAKATKGRPKAKAAKPKSQKAAAGGVAPSAVDVDAVLEKTASLRAEAWSAWGTVDDDVITHIINPAFMGGPMWPSVRQAYRVARAGSEILIASDGLSDPFEDGSRNGYGLEIFAVTDEPLEKPAPSWLFDAVWQMSQFCAQHGGVADLLDELKLITTELYGVKIPDEHAPRFINDAGRVAVLLGMEPAGRLPFRIEGPLSPIRLVNLKLLTLPELAFVLQGGDGAPAELARRFESQGSPLRSSLSRDSVV
jgi:hypothetical protein